MKRRDIIRRAGRNLRRAKGRTILTALAISVGATTIALALAAGEGGRAYTERMLNKVGDRTTILVMHKPEETAKDDALQEYGTTPDATRAPRSGVLGDKDVERMKSIAHVKSVTPIYSVANVTYVQGSQNGKKLVAPISVKTDRSTLHLVAGELPDNMPTAGQVVLAKSFVGQFGFSSPQDALGKTIQLHAEENGVSKDLPVTIVAVDDQSDLGEYYSPSVRISPEDARTLYAIGRPENSPSEYYAVNVFADDAANVPAVQEELNKDYRTQSFVEMRRGILDAVNVMQYGLIGFGGLALLASVFGIVNTMYISVLERTSQIGLMKALGASRRDIGRLFRYEAAWIGVLGGLIGIGIAALITLLNPVIAHALKLQEGTNLLIMTPLPLIILQIGLVMLAVLSGWLPSRRAAKLDPVEALRGE